MKKLIAIITAMTFVVSMATPASAGWTSIASIRKTASVTVGGTAGTLVTFSLSLKNLADNSTASSIAWNAVSGGTTAWLKANQYVQARGFGNWETWGIQVYTDNMRSDASPKYSGTSDPAGLVRADNTLFSIPVCWRTKVGYWVEDPLHPGDRDYGTPKKPGSTAAIPHELEIYQAKLGDYTILYDGVTPHDLDPLNPDDTTKIHAPGAASPYYPWFFALDKNTDSDPNTTGTQTYFTGGYYKDATFIGSYGYHHAPGDIAANFATPSDRGDFYFVYLGANFIMAMPAKTYTTNSLYLEAYHL